MVGLAKMDNFLHNLRACLIGRVFGDRFLVRQARFALFLKGRLPSVKTCPAECFYNFSRPHGAFNGKAPYEILRERL